MQNKAKNSVCLNSLAIKENPEHSKNYKQLTKTHKRKVGGQATSMEIVVWFVKLMSVIFLVRPTLLSRVLVNDFQAIFFILLVLFSFSFLAKKKKKMNKLKARFIAKEKLETYSYRRFFVLKISLIVGFYLYFYKNYVGNN